MLANIIFAPAKSVVATVSAASTTDLLRIFLILGIAYFAIHILNCVGTVLCSIAKAMYKDGRKFHAAYKNWYRTKYVRFYNRLLAWNRARRGRAHVRRMKKYKGKVNDVV